MRDEVAGHELIFGELLIGDIGDRAQLLADYLMMHQAQVVPHGDVVQLVQSRRLHGRGMGWIDAHLLASTIVEKSLLWTADQRFASIAEEMGVCYSPRGQSLS